MITLLSYDVHYYFSDRYEIPLDDPFWDEKEEFLFNIARDATLIKYEKNYEKNYNLKEHFYGIKIFCPAADNEFVTHIKINDDYLDPRKGDPTSAEFEPYVMEQLALYERNMPYNKNILFPSCITNDYIRYPYSF